MLLPGPWSSYMALVCLFSGCCFFASSIDYVCFTSSQSFNPGLFQAEFSLESALHSRSTSFLSCLQTELPAEFSRTLLCWLWASPRGCCQLRPHPSAPLILLILPYHHQPSSPAGLTFFPASTLLSYLSVSISDRVPIGWEGVSEPLGSWMVWKDMLS